MECCTLSPFVFWGMKIFRRAYLNSARKHICNQIRHRITYKIIFIRLLLSGTKYFNQLVNKYWSFYSCFHLYNLSFWHRPKRNKKLALNLFGYPIRRYRRFKRTRYAQTACEYRSSPDYRITPHRLCAIAVHKYC